ncbi:ABC transporter permease [Candidatus Acetothermia bacterium]|jgi:simple sugar transport system permease protein|nr:ABC transporter permease [Candidatus Acetothermia bacterium]MCI2427346.1 ABC transporter permease [Candidatus Acetothermia bacterium]MCI2428148.1 ABC transporter permease [Candidatus Acetothermia bacterium]
MADILQAVLNVGFAFAIIRITTPIAFAALGAIITDLAGTINIALEGIMLQAAFWGVFVSAITQNVWLGLAAGVLSGLSLAAILGYLNLHLKADLIIAGIALNILAAGSTVFFLYVLAGDRGVSVSLRSLVLPSIVLPVIAEIPAIGAIISGHHILTYVAILAVFVLHYLLYKTPFGLRLRAVGEHPVAAQSVGISTVKIKFIALLLSGLLASLGGLFISMGYVSWFSRDMIAGRGFIGLIAAAVAGRSAWRTLGGALIFGTAEALTFVLPIWGIASELTNMFPYVITLIALTIWGRKRIRSGKRQIDNTSGDRKF